MRHLLVVTLPVLAIQAQAPTSSAIQHMAELQKAGKWAELADAFEALPPPERAPHLGAWLEALNRSKRWTRMVEVCEAAEPQFVGKPAYLDLLKRKVGALVKLERHLEAARCCERIGDGGEAYYYIQALDLARQANDWPVMSEIASKLLAARPKDPIGLAVKGEALARMERFSEAEPFLQDAVVANPKDPWVLVNLACCLNERKAWSEALAACDRALALDPKVVPARINRGRACFQLARYQEAKEDYEAALVELPGNPMLQENLRQATRYLEAQKRGAKGKS
jgi:tetratricopeptide (TPR) repeat protein